MPGRVRPENQRAQIEAEARALRERGATMIEISKAVNVPVPTLYRWAAENDWRGRDLAQAAWEEAYANPALAEHNDDSNPRAVGVGETGTRSTRGREASKEAEPNITSGTLHAQAKHLLLTATRLTEAGQLKQAEAALRLADRFSAAAAALTAEAPETHEPPYDPRKELERRLLEYAEREARAKAETEAYAARKGLNMN